MTQLSPKKILETPNEIAATRSKSNLLTNRQRQESGTLNQEIYKKLFEKFNQREESPQSSGSGRRMVDINEVYKLRKEMMEKYDKHVQSKRRLSMQNQNLKQLLKCKSERTGTKIGTSQEPSILAEERRLSKIDIQDFLLRVERSQERKENGLSRAASQKSIKQQQWKMLPKSRMIVSRSLDKNAFQQTLNSVRKAKPLFETFNFSPKIKKSISKTELKREQQDSERRFNHAMTAQDSEVAIKFEIDKMHASIRDVVKQAPLTQSLLATKTKKKINKIFQKHFEAIQSSDGQVDMVNLLKLLGAITSCTVEKRLVQNHQNLQHNVECFVLAILDLSGQDINDDRRRSSQFIVNKFLSEDKVKSAAQIVSQLEPISFTVAQERRIQQHFADFAKQLRKKRLSTVKYRTALGSPKLSKAAFEAVDLHKQSQYMALNQDNNTVSSETFKLKRDHYLNQMIESTDKLPESQPEAFQKRLTQADLRSAVQSQLASRKSLDRLDGLTTNRKSVNTNPKSRNTPAVYSQATENQIRTVRNKSRADLAQMLQQTTSKKRPSVKRPLTRQSDTTAHSPRVAHQFKAYDPAAAVAAQNLLDKCVVLSGRTSKASNAPAKKQPLTSKKKATTTATIVLENRAPLFVQPPVSSTQNIKADTILVNQSGRDQEGPSLPELECKQVERQLTPKSLSIDIELPTNHAFQLISEQAEAHNQSSKQITIDSDLLPENFTFKAATQINFQEAKVEETAEYKPTQEEQYLHQEQVIDQQSRPSETIELKRDSEPLFDQQSRPSEKLEAVTVDQYEQVAVTPTKRMETEAEKLSDSQISQNQGQQMEEQGAKDIDHSNSANDSEELLEKLDDQKSLQLNEANIPFEIAEQEQLIQARFSNISKKSSSKFLSDSIVDSDDAVLNVEFEGQEVQKIKPDEKFTITEIGTSDAPNDNLIEQTRPKYMTFSQPSQDQEEQNPVSTREANESEKAILLALNLTHEIVKNDEIDYSVKKQVSGSEQGKDTERIESEQQNLTASPRSETAFEKYQRLKKERESSLQDSAAKDRQSSCGSRQSNKAPQSGKYTPRHTSPKMSHMSDQRSWKSEVQVEMLEFRDENHYPLREEQKSPVLVESTTVVTVKPLQVEFSCATVPDQLPKLEGTRKLKNLSFAEDLNQQTYSSQDQVLSKGDSLTDLKPSLTIEVPNQLSQIDNQDSQIQEAVPVQNIEIKRPDVDDITKVELLPDQLQENLEKEESPATDAKPRLADQVEQDKKESRSSGQQSEDLWLPDPVAPEQTVELEKEQIKETKPKESIQGQLHAIKQGFLQFMNKKTNDQESSQAQPEKQPASTTSQVYGQVNDMIKRVQDNLKEKAQESQIKQQEEGPQQEKPLSQTSQVFDSVNGMLKKVQDNMKQTNLTDIFKSPSESMKDTLKPLQNKVQQSIPNSVLKSIADKIPSETINKFKSQLPQNSLSEMVTSTTENLKEGDFLGSVLTAAQDQARLKLKDTILADIIPVTQKPLTVENPYLKIERASNKQKEEAAAETKTKFVDRMAPVLDKLDQEYEAELKNKPKITELKNQKRQNRDDSSLSQSGTLVRKKTADSSASSKKIPSKSRTTPPTSTPLKKSKTDQAPQKKKVQSTPKPVEKIQDPKPIRKQSAYHAFPSRIVDAPEIMFFLPSWFQINGKRNKK